MFNLGHPIAQIADQRGLAASTIENHLAYYVANGKLPVEKVLTAERIATIENAIDKATSIGLAPIKELLGDEYSYGEIRLVLAHREFTSQRAQELLQQQ